VPSNLYLLYSIEAPMTARSLTSQTIPLHLHLFASCTARLEADALLHAEGTSVVAHPRSTMHEPLQAQPSPPPRLVSNSPFRSPAKLRLDDNANGTSVLRVGLAA